MHTAAAVSGLKPIKTQKVLIDDVLLPAVWLCDECLSVWQKLQNEEDRETFVAESCVPVCGKDFDEVMGVSAK